jgi:predicted MFS family arabinose efflux permease
MVGYPPSAKRKGTAGVMGMRWIPLVLLFGLGMSNGVILPIWLSGAFERFHFSPLQGGMVASLEMGCLAIASIAWASLSRGKDRVWLAAALLFSIGANVASYTTGSAAIFIASRAVTGLSLGLVLAGITGAAARMPNAHRVFSLQQLGLIAFAFIFFTSVSVAVSAYGPSAPFLYVIALSAIGLVSLLWLTPMPTSGPIDAQPAGERQATRTRAASGVGMTFIAIALSFMAQTGVWTYISDAARSAGVGLELMSRILAVGTIANVLASIAAERIGSRLGRLAPLLVGYLGLGFAILMVAFSREVIGFAIGAVGISFFLLFLMPFLLNTLAMLDPSGRSASAGPAFFTIGGTIGPAAAGLMIDKAGFPFLGIVLVGVVICAFVLAMIAGGKTLRPATADQTA